MDIPACIAWCHPFIDGFSQSQRGIALGAHNLAGDVALGAAAHFKASDNLSAVTFDKIGVVRRFDRSLPSVKVARLNRQPVPEDPQCLLDALLL